MGNREIKFRFWSIDNNEMISNESVNKDHAYRYLINESDERRYIVPMQFTGLKDKKGVDIYEGDILSKKWIVEVYKNNEGTYMVRFHTNPKVNKPQSLFSYLKKREKAGTSDRDCIKIGNIHENHELLNKQPLTNN